MRAPIAVLFAGLVAAPAFADQKLDPDPSFLPKARTAATATVEPHYDLASDKVPFWARFVICAGQLSAIRDEGRALPAAKDELDRLIGDYRVRAADLIAYRAKADPKTSALDADAEIAKVRSGAMQFLPGDVTKIGVETMKKRATERLTFCQLTRDWYEVQNGLRQAVPATEQQRLSKVHDEAMKEIAAAAPKPPKVWQLGAMPPAIKPSVVQPIQRPKGPEAAPIPTAKVIVPAAGAPAGGQNPKDAVVGSDMANAATRTEFAGRALWSALAECSARLEVIQAKTGDSTQVWISGYLDLAAYILWGDREIEKSSGAALASSERDRLRARAAAGWDAYRQEHGGAIPHASWGQTCGGLQQHAYAYAQRLRAARQAKADREYAEYLRKFNETRAAAQAAVQMTPHGEFNSASIGYSSGSGNSSLSAAAAASRAEHARNMQQYKTDMQRIRSEIRAIDRKYR